MIATTGETLPPQNLDAERALLGSMFFSSEAVDLAMQAVDAADFYGDSNRRLFGAIVALHDAGRKIDPVTVAEQLRSTGDLDEVGGVPYVVEVSESVPSAWHADHYAELVREESTRRQAIQCGHEIIRRAYDKGSDVQDVVAESEHLLHDLMERGLGTGDSASINDLLLDAFSQIGAAKERGCPTGFNALDAWTFGWQPGQLVIVAARPSVGKTALACNFAVAAARSGKPVMYFSLEQGRLQLAERFMALSSGVDGNKIKAGGLDDDERQRVLDGANDFSRLPIDIDDHATRTVSQVAARCRLKKRRTGLGLVIIDYLQLLTADDRRIPREQQVATISRGVANLSRDLEVPVMVLAQLNRAFEARSDKRPRLSDLRESGSLEQDARMVLLIDRPHTYEPGKFLPHETKLSLAKNSEGQTGRLDLSLELATGRFEEASNADDRGDFMERDLGFE